MGLRRTRGSLVEIVRASEQRQAYNNFRKVRVLYERIVERTPVLSGELRANWRVGYGKPNYATNVKVHGKSEVMVPLAKPTFDLAYDREKAWTMYVVNGTPYAHRVEHGWSDQAPVGMMRISLMEVFGVGLR